MPVSCRSVKEMRTAWRLAGLAAALALAAPAPSLPTWAEAAARAACEDFKSGLPDEQTVAARLGAMADTIAVTNPGPPVYSATALRPGHEIGLTVRLIHLSGEPLKETESEPLNPPVPQRKDPGGGAQRASD